MNATEAPHNAAPHSAAGPRAANATRGAASAAPARAHGADADAPADPFAALLDGLCVPDAEGASAQAAGSATVTDPLAQDAPAQGAARPGAAPVQPAGP